jgi:serine/threonine protein kinase
VIEIPGYRIVRQLGRGGMATVYLAIQESVDREVALKVMSPQLLVDPHFGERFLREARIAAKLHHRHVVGVHDVGKHGDLHYIAMEYLPGGPILTKAGESRDVAFALRVSREVSTALGYAHAKGFIHRDVKPDNILIRSDGSSALTDFGIARAADSATRMTRTGAVIGTPHYMSPEQARGRTVDGRADLYSLGVVLYELLVGRVPYHAEDSLAVGIMHITEPVPQLPERLLALQPMLDMMLSKRPEERYQTGEEMAAAIREYEVAIANGELPSLLIPSQAQREQILGQLALATPPSVAAPPIARPDPAAEIAAAADARSAPTRSAARESAAAKNKPTKPMSARRGDGRAEPTVGRIDEIDAGPLLPDRSQRGGHAEPKSGRRGWLWGSLAFALVAGGVLAWLYQERLRALFPDTELNALLSEADKARADGQLTGNAGLSARELYLAVLKQDADNAQAIAGLRHVGEDLIANARDALTQGELARARALAASAREVLQGGAALDALDAEIRATEQKSVAVGDLLERALAAQSAGRLVGGDDSAAVWFQRALQADPDSGIAQKGMNDIVAALGQQAEAALAAGKLDQADARIADIEALRPGHVSVPELRAKVSDARAQAAQAVMRLVERAEAQARAGRLAGGADDALGLFQQALAADPNQARAQGGLQRLAGELLAQVDAALSRSDSAGAQKWLDHARVAGASATALRAAQVRVRELRERLEIAAQGSVLTPEQQAKIEKFLADADAALAAGDIFDPPGGNAYDLYRAAMGLDRNNERAKAGVAAIPAKAREAFERALESKRPNTARGLLEGLASVASRDPALAEMRVRLGRAYAALAEQQIDNAQLDAAAKSLARAREFAGNDASVTAAEDKLQTAKGN